MRGYTLATPMREMSVAWVPLRGKLTRGYTEGFSKVEWIKSKVNLQKPWTMRITMIMMILSAGN